MGNSDSYLRLNHSVNSIFKNDSASKTRVLRRKHLFFIKILLLFFGGQIHFAHSQFVASNNYVIRGKVNAIVTDKNGATYLGGGFTSVGFNTGYGAHYIFGSSVPSFNYPKVNGIINAVVAIPGGGWYIGGDFTTVNGEARNRLARINIDGTLHPFNPIFTQSVKALVLDSLSNLFVGSHGLVVKFTSTGFIDTTFSASFNNTVNQLALDKNGNLYVAGAGITFVNGLSVKGLVKMNSLGVVDTTFKINITPSPQVSALLCDSSGNLYIGGSFNSVGGVTRNNLAKFTSTGVLDTFNPNLNSTVKSLVFDHQGCLYVGGQFTSANGVVRNSIVKYDSVGVLTAFNPNIGSSGVYALAIDSLDNVYAGGRFIAVGGVLNRNNLAKFSSTGILDSFNPNVDSDVLTVAVGTSNSLYVGGSFSSTGDVTRNNLAKITDLGMLDTIFNPNINGGVRALVIDTSGNLYVGGDFSTVGITNTRNKLAKFSSTGALTSFNPNIGGGSVKALATDINGDLYVGGNFFSVGGSIPRTQLAKFTSAGVLTSFNPNPNNIEVLALKVDGLRNLFVGGDFGAIAGVSRLGLAKFNSAGVLDPFNPQISQVKALALDASNNLYVGGSFSRVGGTIPRNNLAKYSATGVLDSLNPNIGGVNSVVNCVTLDAAGNLYVVGYFSTVGVVAQSNFAKFSSSGILDPFNPNINASVQAIDASNNKIHIGSEWSPTFGAYGYSTYEINNPVPVKLIAFKVGKINNRANLHWSTASEVDNNYFIIERSLDGRKFIPIGRTKGKGTSYVVQNYQFIDSELPNITAKVYYRLVQVDNNGESHISHIESIDFFQNTDESTFVVYPNPFGDKFVIGFNADANFEIDIQVMDIAGNVLMDQHNEIIKGDNSIFVKDENKLSSGVYFLRIHTPQGVISRKIIKIE